MGVDVELLDRFGNAAGRVSDVNDLFYRALSAADAALFPCLSRIDLYADTSVHENQFEQLAGELQSLAKVCGSTCAPNVEAVANLVQRATSLSGASLKFFGD